MNLKPKPLALAAALAVMTVLAAWIHKERHSAPDSLEPWIDLISDPQLRETTRQELDRHAP